MHNQFSMLIFLEIIAWVIKMVNFMIKRKILIYV